MRFHLPVPTFPLGQKGAGKAVPEVDDGRIVGGGVDDLVEGLAGGREEGAEVGGLCQPRAAGRRPAQPVRPSNLTLCSLVAGQRR